MKNLLLLLSLTAAFTATLRAEGGEYACNPEYLGPTNIVAKRDGSAVYVVFRDASQIVKIDTRRREIVKKFDIPPTVTAMILSHDETKILFTSARPPQNGTVSIMDADSGKIDRTISVGYCPESLAMHPDGKILYVANRFSNDVSVIDPATGSEIKRLKMPREPVSLALTPDGRTLFVANFLYTGQADGYHTAAAVTWVDTATLEQGDILLPDGCQCVRQLRATPDGREVFGVCTLAWNLLPTTSVHRGWTATGGAFILDAEKREVAGVFLLNDPELGASDARDLCFTPDGKTLMIPHGATQDMSIIDLPGLRDKLRTLDAEVKAEKQTEKPYWEVMPEKISVMQKWFLMDGVRTRVELAGHGPREIALAGEFAFIPLFFSDCVAVVNVAEKRRVAEIPPSPPKNDSRTLHLDAQRLGQRIFHDAGKSYQKRDACAVCHPDGRSDGVNWDLMHDGLGNPKNTKSLLYARQTPPATWTGIRTDVKTCAFGMFKHVHFHLATEEEVALVVAYMDSLEPLPSPRLVDGGLSEKARRGQEVFQRVKCGECHVPETFFTDGKMHDVGTENPYDRRADFDTPTLREVWRTAPYLHDGSAPDIYHLLKEKRHGLPQMEGEGLTDEELRALAEYVLTL